MEAKFAALLSAHLPPEAVSRRLFEAENRNMPIFGYGAKAFMLSMIETAVELTDAWRIIENYPRGIFAVLDRAGHGLEVEQALAGEWLDRVEEYVGARVESEE